MTSQQKDIKKLIKQLRYDGWSIEEGKHLKAHHPKGGMIVISRSPSCPFAFKNILSEIKRLNRYHAPPSILDYAP